MPVEFRGSYDVIVCGGGTAGTVAAISAARNGARTLLVEKGPFLGGVSVTGFFPHSFYGSSGKKAVEGIPQELIDELIKLDGSLGHLRYEGGHLYAHTPVDNEILKAVLMQKVMDSGVDLMLNALISDISMQGSRIKSLEIRTKTKNFIATTQTVIDATGDGDIAFRAGAPYNLGRQDKKMQPVSLLMRLTNIDWAKLIDAVPTETPILWANKPRSTEKTPAYFRGLLTQWEDTEEYNQLFTDRNHQLFCLSPWATEATINTTRIVGVNGIDYDDINAAEIKGRKQVLETYRFLVKFVPGFACSNLVTGHSIGVRESRRFVGDYEITEDDVLAGRKFDDNIGLAAYPMDMHDPNGGNVTFKQIGDDGSYGIPYRSLLPQGIDNLLIAGRCLSATHGALASVRSIAACMVMGQATGAAATIASRDRKTMREVDVKELQTILKGQKVILE